MFREYLRNGSISRPLNSPPTYDDAMREVNDAFSYNESSEVEDDPPEYTPQPQVEFIDKLLKEIQGCPQRMRL